MFFRFLTICILVIGCSRAPIEQTSSEALSAKDQAAGNAENLPSRPLSINVSPPTTTVAAGTIVRFSAMGVYPYGIVKDITSHVVWTLSDEALAYFDPTETPNTVTTKTGGTVGVTATFKGISGEAAVTISAATVKALRLSPNPALLNVVAASGDFIHDPFKFTLTGVLSDGTLQDLTDDAKWSVQNTLVASLVKGEKGRVTAQSTGETVVSAAYTHLTAESPLAVVLIEATPKSMVVSPNPVVQPIGGTQQLTVMATYTDGSVRNETANVVWVSDKPELVTVSMETGMHGKVSGILPGAATIKATLGKVEATTIVVATPAVLKEIRVTPADYSLPIGVKKRLLASGVYTDGLILDITSAALWSSLDVSKATISNGDDERGLVFGIAQGPVVLQAALNGVVGTVNLNVSNAQLQSIDITPATLTVPLGVTANFSASGRYSDFSVIGLTDTASWISGNNTIISVSNLAGSKGRITPVAVGTTTLRATHDGINKIINVTVAPANILSLAITSSGGFSMALGLYRQMRCMGTLTTGVTTEFTSDANWTFDILGTGYNYAANVLNTTGQKGKVNSVAIGKTGISCAIGGLTATVDAIVTERAITSMSITGALSTITLGNNQQLTATALYTDGTTRNVTSVPGDPDLTIAWSLIAGNSVTIGNAVNPGLLSSVTEGASTAYASLSSVKFGVFTDFFNIAVQSQCITGTRYNYFCWYWGAFGQSCDQVCGGIGGNYHVATKNFAGSSGSGLECRNVLNRFDPAILNLDDGSANGTASGVPGIGCGLLDIGGDDATARYNQPATDGPSSYATFRRICACDR